MKCNIKIDLYVLDFFFKLYLVTKPYGKGRLQKTHIFLYSRCGVSYYWNTDLKRALLKQNRIIFQNIREYIKGYGNFPFRLIRSAKLGATFNLVTCRITVIFGTMKDDSLLIDTLASNNCLSHRNVFQNGVKTFSITVNHFCQKLEILYISYHTILFKLHQHVAQILIKYFMESLQTSNVSFSNGNIKCPIGNQFLQ